jgi:hypothetical protein
LLRQLSQDVVDRARSVIHETRILRAASLIRCRAWRSFSSVPAMSTR